MPDIAGDTVMIAEQKLSKAYPGYFFEHIIANELGISENITGKYNTEETIALSWFADETNKKIIIKCVNKLKRKN